MILNNSLQSIFTAVVILCGAFLLVSLVRKVVDKRIKNAVAAGRLHVGAVLVDELESSMRSLTYAIALALALGFLTFGERVDRFLAGALLTALAFLAIAVAYSALRLALDASLRRKGQSLEEHKSRALLPVIKFAAWIVVATFLLDNFGFKIGTLLAGLGVAGVAVGFAAQAVLGDLFSYFAILFDRPFRLGDFIVLDGLRGNIEYIGLKTTRIRSLDGEQIVFSNSDLTGSRVRNFQRMTRRRVLFGFGVVYQTTVDQLEDLPALVNEIISSIPKATFDRAHFNAFGNSSLDFEVVYYVEDPDYAYYMDVQQTINLGLVRELAARGIEFAYPTRTLYMAGASATEETCNA